MQQIPLVYRLIASLGDYLRAIVATNLDILVECTLVHESSEELGPRGPTHGFKGRV